MRDAEHAADVLLDRLLEKEHGAATLGNEGDPEASRIGRAAERLLTPAKIRKVLASAVCTAATLAQHLPRVLDCEAEQDRAQPSSSIVIKRPVKVAPIPNISAKDPMMIDIVLNGASLLATRSLTPNLSMRVRSRAKPSPRATPMVKCPISSETRDCFRTRIAVTSQSMRGNAGEAKQFQQDVEHLAASKGAGHWSGVSPEEAPDARCGHSSFRAYSEGKRIKGIIQLSGA
jgi:hypothetical protein